MAETNIKDVKLKIGTEAQFQDKLKDLPIGTLVGTTDPIQEGELDASIINKLNKTERKYYKHSITINLTGNDMKFYNLDKTLYSPVGVSQGTLNFEVINQSAANLSVDEIINILSNETIAKFGASGRDNFRGVGIIYSYILGGTEPSTNISGQMPVACESSSEGLCYLYIITANNNSMTDTVTEL